MIPFLASSLPVLPGVSLRSFASLRQSFLCRILRAKRTPFTASDAGHISMHLPGERSADDGLILLLPDSPYVRVSQAIGSCLAIAIYCKLRFAHVFSASLEMM